MAIPVIETTQNDDSAGIEVFDLTINKPTGTVQDDYILMIAGSDDFSATAHGWDVMTGGATWTEHADAGNLNTDCDLGIQGKVAGASEPSSWNLHTISGLKSQTWARTYRISGINTTTPVDVVGTPQLTSSSSSIAVNAITTTVDDCLLFASFSGDGGDLTPSTVSGTGWTEEAERTSGTGPNDACGSIATRSQASSGAGTSCTFTFSVSDGNVAVQIAIAGAAAGATLDNEFLTMLFDPTQLRM